MPANVWGLRPTPSIHAQGDYFGELALMSDQPRAATVIARSRLTCMVLSRQQFSQLLGPIDELLRVNSCVRCLCSVSADLSRETQGRYPEVDADVLRSYACEGKALRRRCKFREYGHDTVVTEQGATAKALLVVQSGRVVADPSVSEVRCSCSRDR